MQAKVDRLIVGKVQAGRESNLTWVASRPQLVDKRPAFEYLLGMSRLDGTLVPRLAKSWELSPDGLSWSLELEEGVQFHDGWGEFTAQDVVHSGWIIGFEDSILPDRGFWRSRIGGFPEFPDFESVAQQFDVVNDHKLTMNLLGPAAEINIRGSEIGEYMIQSKAYWDAEGEAGYDRHIIGTGPFKYVERSIGEFILYARAENHWRQTPQFEELQIAVMNEPVTRLAALLTGEVHIIDALPADLSAEAQSRGMKLVQSGFPGGSLMFQIGGLYFQTPENLDLSSPLTDVRVRKAMNIAIDRATIKDEVLGSKAEILHVMNYHPTLAINSSGWSDRWVQEYDEHYGYRPDEARQLIVDAGAVGYEFDFFITPSPVTPELPVIAEAVERYWSDIGLSPKLQQVDVAHFRDRYRTKNAHDMVWNNQPAPISQELMTRFWSYSPDGGWSYESERLDELFEVLRDSADRDERDAILTEVGDIWWEDYNNVNLFWILAEVLVDPNVVAVFDFPGAINGIITHLEYVVPVTR